MMLVSGRGLTAGATTTASHAVGQIGTTGRCSRYHHPVLGVFSLEVSSDPTFVSFLSWGDKLEES